MSADDEDFLAELQRLKDVPKQADELPTPDVGVWGMDFIKEYKSVGDRYSFQNPHLHIGFCLALVSQAVGNAHFFTGDGKNSTRVHPLIIQGSGTGKDPAFDFASRVADEAELEMHDMNELSDAGLIGTVKHGEPKAGSAKTADIIGFREATSLFRTTNQDHSVNLSENLNQVLDSKRIKKRLASGSLEYHPNCTLVGTTYEPTDLELQELMTNGLLARFFYFFKPVDDGFRWDMGSEIIERTISPTDDAKRVERFEQLAETIAAINRTFDDQRFWVQPEIGELNPVEKLQSIFEEYDSGTKEVVKPAVTRYVTHWLRISCLMAALDGCTVVVQKRHGKQAWKIVKESWRNLLEFFSQAVSSGNDGSNLRSSELAILKAIINNEGISQTELAEQTGYSKRTIRENARNMEEEDILQAEKDGRKKCYSLARENC